MLQAEFLLGKITEWGIDLNIWVIPFVILEVLACFFDYAFPWTTETVVETTAEVSGLL